MMIAAGLIVLHYVPIEAGTWNALGRVVGPIAVSVAVYAAVLALIGRGGMGRRRTHTGLMPVRTLDFRGNPH